MQEEQEQEIKEEVTEVSTSEAPPAVKEDSEELPYQKNEKLTFVRVRFPGNAKSFPFLIGDRKFTYGQKVLAMSDRGMTVGYINSFPYPLFFHKSMMPIKSIERVATEEDIQEQQSYIEQEKEAEKLCLKLVEKYNLDMNITHVEYMQYGKKAVFYFNAPARVDFRELVKEMVKELKIRIELRQISVRDRTAAIGGIGICGLQTCCSSFLKNYGNVSIKMAKNQNLALIPSKLNGVCGQIKCCIKYEDNVYSEKRNFLPKENSFIKTQNGDIGKVLKLHLIVEQFDMLTDKGKRRRYSIKEYIKKDSAPPKSWNFPTSFDHITDETSTVIGLTSNEQQQAEDFLSSHFLEKSTEEVVEKEAKAPATPEKEDEAPKRDNKSKNRRQNNRPRNNKNKEKQASGDKQQSQQTESKPGANKKKRSRRPYRGKKKKPQE